MTLPCYASDSSLPVVAILGQIHRRRCQVTAAVYRNWPLSVYYVDWYDARRSLRPGCRRQRLRLLPRGRLRLAAATSRPTANLTAVAAELLMICHWKERRHRCRSLYNNNNIIIIIIIIIISSFHELMQSRGVRRPSVCLSVCPSVHFAKIASSTTNMTRSRPNLHTMVPRWACT